MEQVHGFLSQKILLEGHDVHLHGKAVGALEGFRNVSGQGVEILLPHVDGAEQPHHVTVLVGDLVKQGC